MQDIMKAFYDASLNSLIVGDNEEDQKLYQELRESLIQGYTSILHGFIPADGDANNARGDPIKENYALQMFCYIQSLVQATDLNFSNEILKNLIELFTDIVLMFTAKRDTAIMVDGKVLYLTPLSLTILNNQDMVDRMILAANSLTDDLKQEKLKGLQICKQRINEVIIKCQ